MREGIEGEGEERGEGGREEREGREGGRERKKGVGVCIK